MISRGKRILENVFGILASSFMFLLGTMGKSLAKICQRHCLTYVVLHNKMRTHQGGVVSAPIPADDIAAITSELAVYMQHENHRNPLRETKTQ